MLRTGGRGQSHKGNKRPPADVFSDGKQRPESQSEPSNDLQPMERERLKRLNQVRWKKLKEETDQLLTLASELKQQVDSSN
ncbi:MAG TPA: hypothetical protein VGQ71_05465, partial [Terriglobales bacterium]|nr:hypothetical protein [Terriglobales bacterium]